jgi:hypothetical protein
MKQRTHKLLSEMQAIFGGSFGDSEVLTESLTEGELEERRKGQMVGRQQPGGGRVGGKKGGGPERGPAGGRPRKGKTFMGKIEKDAKKAAAKIARPNPKNPKNQDRDEKNFDDVMKGIYKDVEKSGSEKRAEKYRRAASKGARAASKGARGGGAGGASGAGAGKEGSKQRVGKKPGAGGRSQHYPFKRSPNLGKGPRGEHHDETKCWKCNCPNGAYGGCECTSTGKGKNCPPAGTEKTITIKPAYKRQYNREYHKWRREQGGRVTARLGATRAPSQ